jgi:phenylalanine-4-hydroxylase
VEFGAYRYRQGFAIFGAGILSSGGEVEYCLSNPRPRRGTHGAGTGHANLEQDRFLSGNRLIDNFQGLFDDTAPDFTPMYQRLASKEALPANSLLAGETNIAV